MVTLYSSLLTTAPLRARMLEMLRTKQPDGAAALLYFLEFPRLVYSARNNHCEDPSSGTKRHGHAPGTAEKFPLRNVLKQIQKDEEILCWCRETLENASAHDVVVASCISLLFGASAIGLATPQKLGPVILGGQALERERAVGNFFDILARNLTRPGLPLGSVCDGLQLAVTTHVTYNHELPLCDLRDLPSAPLFLSAVERLSKGLSESDARKFRVVFNKDAPMDDMLHELVNLNGDRPLDNATMAQMMNYSGQDIVRDGRESLRTASVSLCSAGCGKSGDKKCDRCKLSSYCSRTCQKAHWKAHKKVCKQRPKQPHATDAAGADAATDACAADGGARAAAALAEDYSSSLASSRRARKRAELKRLLKSSGNPDFIITSLPNINFAVTLQNPWAQAAFGISRQVAEDPSVSDKDRQGAMMMMFTTLSSLVKEKMTPGQLWHELQELYGPIPPPAKANFIEVDLARIKNAA